MQLISFTSGISWFKRVLQKNTSDKPQCLSNNMIFVNDIPPSFLSIEFRQLKCNVSLKQLMQLELHRSCNYFPRSGIYVGKNIMSMGELDLYQILE
jgi:hypothetical protein